ncbi:type II toxin-antitoxin system mRNA interferase toxin, RelE/StbE family [Archaeoglobales archaeon]|nr:MAG: type II toxin-antitoxin system mRNA interferase toxin, RelE/StbE family [Archaeoglobales archaeon]
MHLLATDEFKKKLQELTKKNKTLAIQIDNKIVKLLDNPYLGKPLSHEFAGKRSIRVGVYRVIYEIKGDKIILLTIGHRKDVYSNP